MKGALMAQTMEQILESQLGSLMLQLAIKEHQLQTANEKVTALEKEIVKAGEMQKLIVREPDNKLKEVK